MKLTKNKWLHAGKWIGLCLMGMVLGWTASAETVSTTTVQGTVYLANGRTGTGTVDVSWPAFTTASSQAIAAGRMTVTIGQDGFVSVNLAPNLGSTPAGLYYTAVYHLSDGTTSTEYWVVPAATQAKLGQVRAQLMPSTQAVQAVSKAYVDQTIDKLTGSLLTASGGTLSGPLYLNGDPTQSLQAADKHYVDSTFSMEVPITGGSMTGALADSSGFVGPLTGDVKGNVTGTSTNVTGVVDVANGGTGASTAASALTKLGGLPLSGGTLTGTLVGPAITATQLGGTYQVDQFSGADFGAKLQACLSAVNTTYGGTCDARNFTGNLSMTSNLNISTANVTVLLPCATISTASQVIVTAGTRNVALRGCALRGASNASGSQGGTVFLYSGSGAMVQVGDSAYASDTMGFHIDNAVINTTASSSATAQGLVAYRTQEMDLESLYFLGNSNQTGMTLDGTGNYTGGTFLDDSFNGFQTAVNAIGHQATNAATTDWVNASAFMRLHIDCPMDSGSPISGTYGINLQQGDGNTFTGGDVEGCSTALHLGANAQNNTIVGLRNENSTNQVVADEGSTYNNWITGGTMFTGKLTDNGTRNSFLDTFHRSFNGVNGDWYGSQQDATVINHYRIGIGAGNERGLLNRYQSDYGYRWTTGLSDATAGEQFYQVLDELNNVYRLSIGQYNYGQSSTNNQTVINAAGSGAIVLNGSNNSGTGGVIIGSGGASESTVATINNTGNAQFNGTLQVGGASTFSNTTTVKNHADAEVDATLWAGLTANQKESFLYKDWNGNSQWYMVKDTNNNWALNSATGGLDSFKAYQSTNSGDTYINTANSSGVIRLNYESGSSGRTYIYGGSSSSLIAAFSGTTAISFPGLAASSGHNCLQIDNSGYITNTGSACGSGGVSGTVNSGNAGQIAYYTASGTSIGGVSTIPVTAGGTGAATAASGLANLGGQPQIPGLASDNSNGIRVTGTVAAGTTVTPFMQSVSCTGQRNGVDQATVQAAINYITVNAPNGRGTLRVPEGQSCYIYMPSTSTATEALLMTSPISIEGEGQIYFDVPSTMDWVRIAPLKQSGYWPATGYYAYQMVWRDVTMNGSSAVGIRTGTGRHSINFDCTNGGVGGGNDIGKVLFDNVFLGYTATGNSLYANNTGTYAVSSGCVYLAAFTHNTLQSGIHFYGTGDTISISKNQINNPNGDGLYLASISGAVDNVIEHNNIVANGSAIHITQGSGFHIYDNEVGVSSYNTIPTTATIWLENGSGGLSSVVLAHNIIGADQAIRPEPLPLLQIDSGVKDTRIEQNSWQPEIVSNIPTPAILNNGSYTCLADNQIVPQSPNYTIMSGNGSLCKDDLVSESGLGDLLENRLLYSEDLTKSPVWATSYSGAASAPVVSTVSTTLPDGTTGNATRIQMALNGGASSGDIAQIQQAIAGLTNPHSSVSQIFVKSNTGTLYTVGMLQGAAGEAISVDATGDYNGWRHPYIGIPAVTNSTSDKLVIRISGGAVYSDSIDILVWGAQQSTNKSRYIKTTNAPVTKQYGINSTRIVGGIDAAQFTGVCTIANGCTGQTTQQAAINALTGTQAAGSYLRSDGTNALLKPLYLTLSAYDGAAVVSSYGFLYYTPSAAINITRIAARITTQATGCTTAPEIAVTNGTNTAYVTISNGVSMANAAPTGTSSMVAGTLITVEHLAGTGCTTNPTIANVTVEYTE